MDDFGGRVQAKRRLLSRTLGSPKKERVYIPHQIAASTQRAVSFLDRWHWLWLTLAAPFLLFPSPARSVALFIVPGVWIAAWLAKGEPVPHTPLNVTLLLLSLMMLISLYATYDIAVSLPKIAGLVLGIGVFYAYVRLGRHPQRWWLGFLIFLAIGAGIAGLGLLSTQWLTKIGFLTPLISRLPRRLIVPGAEEGLHPNEVAGALLWIIPPLVAFSMLILLRVKQLQAAFGRGRVIVAALLVAGVTVFVAGAFVLTQSRGGYIALALSGLGVGVIVLPPRKRWLLAGGLVILATAIGVAISHYQLSAILFNPMANVTSADPALSLGTLEGRMRVWVRAIYAIQDFPFTGMGLNAFRHMMQVFYPLYLGRPDFDVSHAHNEFLQAALDLGIPGLIAFIAFYIGAFGMLAKLWRTALNGLPLSSSGPSTALGTGVHLPTSNLQFLALGLGGGLFAHLLYGLTDAVALGAKPGILFWMLLGLITGLFEQVQSGRKCEPPEVKASVDEQGNLGHSLKFASSLHLFGGSRKHAWKLLIAALLFALFLRLAFLGSKSLWFDETLSLSVAKAGQAALWAGISEPYHPPLFYWILGYWIRLGESEFILRLPSAILGAMSVLLMYPLGKDLIGKRASLSAVWLFALSPLLIWYSQEVRSYSLLIFIGLIATTAGIRLFLRPRLMWWLLFVIAMITALYIHYIAFLLMPVQLVLLTILLAKQRSRWPAILFWLAGWVIIIMAYLPWLQTPKISHFFYQLVTDRSGFVLTLADDFNISPVFIQLLMIGAVGLFLAAPVGLFLACKFFQKPARSWLRLRRRNWVQASLALFFIALLIASVIPRAYTLKRQLVLLWPFGLLVFGWFWPWRQRYQKLLTMILLASLLASFVNVAWIPKDQWRETVSFIIEQSQPQDAVLLAPGYVVIPFNHYSHGRIAGTGIQSLAVASQLQSLLNDHKRVWLVSYQADIAASQKEAEAWFSQHAVQTETAQFFHIQVRLYEKK